MVDLLGRGRGNRRGRKKRSKTWFMGNKNSLYITTGWEDQKHLSRVNIFLLKQWRDGTALGVEIVTSGRRQIRGEGTRRWTAGGFLKANRWHLGPPGPELTWALQPREESTCQRRRCRSDGWEDALEKEMATHFLPGESPGQRRLAGVKKLGQDLAYKESTPQGTKKGTNL